MNRFLLTCCISAFACISLISCNENTGLGSNILPSNKILNPYFVDTATVLTSIKLSDSIPANGAIWNLLGSYNDPVFGLTSAALYTQVDLPGNISSIAFGPYEAKTLDSVVLQLPYNYGNTTYYGSLGAQTFVVDTLSLLNNSLPLVSSKLYYSSDNLPHSSRHIGMATITPNVTQPVSLYYPNKYNAYNYTPLLRIRLNNSFGQYIMSCANHGYPQGDSSYYLSPSTPANFLNLLKGLCISTSNPSLLPGQGGILSINQNIVGAGLYFYYRYYNTAISAWDTALAAFTIGNSASFNNFSHDYSTTKFYVPGKDSIYSPNVAYVQGMAGVKTQITFPYLSNWISKSTPNFLNKAELDIPVNTTATGIDIPAGELNVVMDSLGYQSNITDYYMGLGWYGGTWDATNHQYVFNITRYIQYIIDGKKHNFGLYLVDGAEAIDANGVVLYGSAKNPANVNQRVRLKMFYTPLKQ